MLQRIFFFIILALLIEFAAFSQNANRDTRRGNREFRNEGFQDAELNYRKALESDPQNINALYNLAAALYKQGRYEEAANILEGLANMPMTDNKKADVFHNLGNASIGAQKIQEGVDAFKNSLRIRPDDMDTRHNLAYALRMLQEQEQQQQNQDNQDDNQDQQDQDQQPQDQQDEQQQQQQERQRPDQISPQDAERILDALNQQEQDVQQKIDREERVRQPLRPQRQW